MGDQAVGIALTCLSSWGRGMRELATPGDLRVMVRDEVWKQMRLGVEAVKSFDGDLRLSRSHGDIQWANAHKPSDLLSVGEAGSQAVAIAKDLLHLADIKILHGQDAAVARDLEQLMGLGPIAQDVVTGWAMHGKGRALWCVGDATLQGPNRPPPPRSAPHLHQPRPRRRRVDAPTSSDRALKPSTDHTGRRNAVNTSKLWWALGAVLAMMAAGPLVVAILVAAVLTPAAVASHRHRLHDHRRRVGAVARPVRPGLRAGPPGTATGSTPSTTGGSCTPGPTWSPNPTPDRSWPRPPV